MSIYLVASLSLITDFHKNPAAAKLNGIFLADSVALFVGKCQPVIEFIKAIECKQKSAFVVMDKKTELSLLMANSEFSTLASVETPIIAAKASLLEIQDLMGVFISRETKWRVPANNKRGWVYYAGQSK